MAFRPHSSAIRPGSSPIFSSSSYPVKPSPAMPSFSPSVGPDSSHRLSPSTVNHHMASRNFLNAASLLSQLPQPSGPYHPPPLGSLKPSVGLPGISPGNLQEHLLQSSILTRMSLSPGSLAAVSSAQNAFHQSFLNSGSKSQHYPQNHYPHQSQSQTPLHLQHSSSMLPRPHSSSGTSHKIEPNTMASFLTPLPPMPGFPLPHHQPSHSAANLPSMGSIHALNSPFNKIASTTSTSGHHLSSPSSSGSGGRNSKDPFLVTGLFDMTLLENQRIACFDVGGEKRLCLPQVLHILPQFNITQINEVLEDLGIVCSRCNSFQLVILKDRGILPVNISSCGLITKSDAERLCKTLLYRSVEKNQRGYSSANSFTVRHNCFGKQRGTFLTELYTNPEARCIECSDCQGLFAPEKFVGHSHHQLERRTCHWGFDSANWRHYLHLARTDAGRRSESSDMMELFDSIKAKFGGAGSNGNGLPLMEKKRKIEPSPYDPSTAVSKRRKQEESSVIGEEIARAKSPRLPYHPLLKDPEHVISRTQITRFDQDYTPNLSLTSCPPTASRILGSPLSHNPPSTMVISPSKARPTPLSSTPSKTSISTSVQSGPSNQELISLASHSHQHYSESTNPKLKPVKSESGVPSGETDKIKIQKTPESNLNSLPNLTETHQFIALESQLIESIFALNSSSDGRPCPGTPGDERSKVVAQFSAVRQAYLDQIRQLITENRYQHEQIMSLSTRKAQLEAENSRLVEEKCSASIKSHHSVDPLQLANGIVSSTPSTPDIHDISGHNSASVSGIQTMSTPGMYKLRAKYSAVKEELNSKAIECLQWQRRYQSSERRRRHLSTSLNRLQGGPLTSPISSTPSSPPFSPGPPTALRPQVQDGVQREEIVGTSTETESETETKHDLSRRSSANHGNDDPPTLVLSEEEPTINSVKPLLHHLSCADNSSNDEMIALKLERFETSRAKNEEACDSSLSEEQAIDKKISVNDTHPSPGSNHRQSTSSYKATEIVDSNDGEYPSVAERVTSEVALTSPNLNVSASDSSPHKEHHDKKKKKKDKHRHHHHHHHKHQHQNDNHQNTHKHRHHTVVVNGNDSGDVISPSVPHRRHRHNSHHSNGSITSSQKQTSSVENDILKVSSHRSNNGVDSDYKSPRHEADSKGKVKKVKRRRRKHNGDEQESRLGLWASQGPSSVCTNEDGDVEGYDEGNSCDLMPPALEKAYPL